MVAVDTETVDLKNRELLGVGVALSPDEGLYVPRGSQYWPELIRIIQNPTVKKVYHNSIFDLQTLAPYQPDMTNIADTLVMSNLLGMHGDLSRLAHDLLSFEVWNIADIMDIELDPNDPNDQLAIAGRIAKGQKSASYSVSMFKKVKNMTEVSVEKLAEKCIRDCRATYGLYMLMTTELLTRCSPQYLQSEFELIPVLVKMSLRGIKLDQSLAQQHADRIRAEVYNLTSLCDDYGFNPASPVQVGYILTQRGNKLPKRGKGWVTDEKALRWLKDPLAQLVLEHRHSSKLLSSYLNKWIGSDRVYSTFHMGPETGRLASKDVPLQNVPKGDLRNCLLPDSGVFTDFDYQQQELRILAYISGDSNLIQVCETSDPHQSNADFMGIKRGPAKNVTYAMTYGGSVPVIMETAGITDYNLARQLKDVWMKKYPAAWKWIQTATEQGMAERWVHTLMGRPVAIPLGNRLDENGHIIPGISDIEAAKKPVNFTIQGTGGDVIKQSLRLLTKAGIDIALTVHDENLIDGYVSKQDLLDLGMETILPFRLPIDVRHLTRWE